MSELVDAARKHEPEAASAAELAIACVRERGRACDSDEQVARTSARAVGVVLVEAVDEGHDQVRIEEWSGEGRGSGPFRCIGGSPGSVVLQRVKSGTGALASVPVRVDCCIVLGSMAMPVSPTTSSEPPSLGVSA
jgi:hypothetical protein